MRILTILFVLFFLAGLQEIQPLCPLARMPIPTRSDWQETGATALEPGLVGSWDVRLGGAVSPCAVVKKDGTYFLYYIGADGNRLDGGPRHRALGVVTSQDGINFTKYHANPVLTYLPHQGWASDQEEGIFSCAASLDSQENVILYYGGIKSAGARTVHIDIRLAESSNGFDFTDRGEVLAWDDKGVWGSGDEIWPVGVYEYQGTWYVYYVNSGSWNLGVAWGPSPDSLIQTTRALSVFRRMKAGADPIWISSHEIALFLQVEQSDVTNRRFDIRTTMADEPAGLTTLEDSYGFGPWSDAMVYLDWDELTWFMYYFDVGETELRVRVAQMGTVSVPVELASFHAIQFGKRVRLEWQTVSETNNLGFEVQRKIDNQNEWQKVNFVTGHGTTNEPQQYFFEDGVVQSGSYCYRLKQIDFDGKFEYSKVLEVKIRAAKEFALHQNYPNPFNPTTTIEYVLPSPCHVVITLYNTKGQLIQTLVSGHKQAGIHQIVWDAQNNPAGVYLLHLQVGNYSQNIKMILLK